jgi:hypothetical protein
MVPSPDGSYFQSPRTKGLKLVQKQKTLPEAMPVRLYNEEFNDLTTS